LSTVFDIFYIRSISFSLPAEVFMNISSGICAGRKAVVGCGNEKIKISYRA
jgi:hypothetical protein